MQRVDFHSTLMSAGGATVPVRTDWARKYAVALPARSDAFFKALPVPRLLFGWS